MAKNEFYRDFSNRKSFNNAPVGADEELVPTVLTKDMKVTLKPLVQKYEDPYKQAEYAYSLIESEV